MIADSQRASAESRQPIEVELRRGRSDGYAARVRLCGEHGLHTAAAMRIALLPLSGNVLVDLSECDYIDSTVITVLLEKSEDLRREGHRLELFAPPHKKTVRRIIDVVGLETVIAVHELMPSDHERSAEGTIPGD